MENNKKELLNRVLLLMNYDNKKTLNENRQVIIKEGDEKWSSTYSCVPKHPNAKKVTLSDGSTAYTIWGATYYNNGKRAVSNKTSTNYSCNDMMFKYPKNQTESDKFRNWMFKNYDAKSLKSSYDLDPKGPWNSVAVLKAWSLYGTTYLDKKGNVDPKNFVADATFDEKCGNKPNMVYDNYYKKCILSEKRQETLANSVGFDIKNIGGEGKFLVKSEAEWYGVYAVYMSQYIETAIAEKWGWDTSKGSCKGSSDGSKGLSFPNKGNMGDLPSVNLMKAIKTNLSPNSMKVKRNISQMYTICFNESIVFGKPYNDIDYDNITVTNGRLNRNSFNNYDGYIPSYDEVIKAYGINSVESYINLFREAPHDSFDNKNSNSGEVINKVPSVKWTVDDVHNLLMALEIGSAFIPVAGPLLSIGFGLIDAGIYSVIEDNPEMGSFVLIMTILPELKIASNLFKSAKYAKAYKSLLKKSESGVIESLTKEELEFVEQLKQLNSSELNKEVKQELSKKADEILVKDYKETKLSQEDYNALNKFTSGAKTHSVKFVSLDLFLGLAGGLSTKYGRELISRMFGLFKKNSEAIKSLVDTETGEINQEALAEVINDMDKLANATPEEKNRKKEMENIISAFENNPEEFKSYVEKKEVREKVQSEAENYIKSKGLDVAEMEDIESILNSIPD